MREILLNFYPTLQSLASRTKQTILDDRAVELLGIILRSQEAWNWFVRLFRGDNVIMGANAGDAVYPSFVGCPCPPSVTKFLDGKQETYGKSSASGEPTVGAGLGTIFLLIKIVKTTIDYLVSIGVLSQEEANDLR